MVALAAFRAIIYNTPFSQEMILELIWGLWSELPAHGRKAAQFVDLLGYFSLLRSDSGPADEGI